jgi:hypothetical protein
LPILIASIILLLSASVWIGAERYLASQKQQEILQRGERERWLAQGDKESSFRRTSRFLGAATLSKMSNQWMVVRN